MATIESRWLLVLGLVLLAASPAIAQQKIAPGEVPIANQGGYELAQDVAYNTVHDEFLVVWSDWNFPTGRIMGRRLRYDGRPLGTAFQVAPSTGSSRSSPVVAYDRVHDYYLVAYGYEFSESDRDVLCIFLSWDGVALTEEQVLANTGAYETPRDVAFSWMSSKFLVTWTESGSPFKLKGILIGNPSGAAFTIVEGADGYEVAWEPWSDNFLAIYERGGDIFGKLIHASGTVGSEIAIAGWPASEGQARVATCENFQFLVVWNSPSDLLNDPFDSEVYGRFLLGNGTFWGDPIHFNGSSLKDWRPRVACLHGGIDYLVAYTQSSETGTPWWWESQLYAQRLRSTGALEPLGFVPISPPTGKQDDVAIVAGSRVGWLITVMRGDDLAPAPSDWDLYGRVAWQLFSDSFEWGSTSAWGAHIP